MATAKTTSAQRALNGEKHMSEADTEGMRLMRERNLTVRFDTATLDELQVIAMILDQSISDLVRTAVSNHVEVVASAPEFKEKTQRVRREQAAIFDSLLRVATT